MKTILRLMLICLVIGGIAIGLYVLFQNPTVQSWLGLESGFGRTRWAAQNQANPLLLEREEEAWGRGGQGGGFGDGRRQAEGYRGRGIAGDRQGEHDEALPLSVGWLIVLGNFLRLAILMSVVILVVKLARWVGKATKRRTKLHPQNANP